MKVGINSRCLLLVAIQLDKLHRDYRCIGMLEQVELFRQPIDQPVNHSLLFAEEHHDDR